MGSRVTRTSGVLVAVLMALPSVLVACGGDEEPEAEPTPSESTTSATPSPSPTRTEEPLSEFEDKPQVKAVRTFFVRAARAVNANDAQLSNASGVLTRNGKADAPGTIAEDLGLYYPGPIPFTPTRVSVDGRTAVVAGCVVGQGFALERKGGKRAAERSVASVRFAMVRTQGSWKIDEITGASLSCDGVKVRGVKW